MSFLPELRPLLQALMSPDNTQRKNAEEVYFGALEGSLLDVVVTLLGIMESPAEDLVLRVFSGVLLRRVLDPFGTFWPRLNSNATIATRSKLVEIWANQQDRNLLRKVAHVMATNASKGDWNDLIPAVLEHQSKTNAQNAVSALFLLENLSEYCPEAVEENLDGLVAYYAHCFELGDKEISIAAARATTATAVSISSDVQRSKLTPLLGHVLSALSAVLNEGDDLSAQDIIQGLVDVALDASLMFRENFGEFAAAMITVARAAQLEFSTRIAAVEFILTFAKAAPALARRQQEVLTQFIPLLFEILADIEADEREWMEGAYDDLADTEDDSIAGAEGIDRLTSYIGGRTVVPIVLGVIAQGANSQDWRQRYAAVRGLASLVEGDPKYCKQHVESAVQLVSVALRDNSQRTKYAALYCLGRLACAYEGAFQAQFHAHLIPDVVKLMADPTMCPRVHGHCCAALINFYHPQQATSEQLAPYQDDLLRALVTLLQGSTVEVQEQCLILLGCVALVAELDFSAYYQDFMPGIKGIMQNATSPAHAQLRAKAMECIGLIGEAVGPEVFAADAREVMELLVQTIQHYQDQSVPDEISTACARICKTLKADFLPYLPYVLPPLYAAAAAEVGFDLEDADDDEEVGAVTRDDETGMEATVLNFPGIGNKRVMLNTFVVNQKHVAARTLNEYSHALKGDFAQYIDQTAEALLPLVVFKFSEDVRGAASLGLGALFEAATDASRRGLRPLDKTVELMRSILMHLVVGLKGEIRPDSRACMAEGIRDVLAACYQTGEEQLDGSRINFAILPTFQESLQLCEQLLSFADASVKRLQSVMEALQESELHDEEDMEMADATETEQDLGQMIADALGHLIKLHKGAFVPVFAQHIAPFYSQFMNLETMEPLRILAVCIFDDVIEHGGEQGHQYVEPCMPVFLASVGSEDLTLRQSSVYGIAQVAKVAPGLFAQYLDQAVPILLQIVSAPDAKDDESIGVTENALSALGSVLVSFQNVPGVDLSSIAQAWLQGLPVGADEQEARLCHRRLCDFIENNVTVVTGESWQNLPEILRIVGEILYKVRADPEEAAVMVDEQTVQRLAAIVRGFPADVLQSASAQLSQEQLEGLQSV